MEAAIGTSDIIAIVAASIALLSLILTFLMWRTSTRSATAAETSATNSGKSADAAETSATESRRSADAAERSATASERSVELAEAEQNAAAARRDTAERNEASLVTVSASFTGALAVFITNNTANAIGQVQIDDVASADHHELRWRLIAAVVGAQAECPVIRAGEFERCPVEFVDEQTGHVLRFPGQDLAISFSFTDPSGQRWSRVNDDPPQRVESE